MTGAHVPGCTGKTKYGDEATALATVARSRPKHQPKKTLNAYLCKHCSCWHLTHWTPERQAGAVARTNARRAWADLHARPLWERVHQPFQSAKGPEDEA